MSDVIKGGRIGEVINVHDLGIAGGYIIEQALGERIAELAAENAKLRELVREMYAAIDMADYVHDFDDPIHLMFVDDLRELGVEVDG